jgi:hypothetical protein
LEPDFNTITKLDPLNVPTAISLTDTVEKNSFSTPNLREGHAASHINKSRSPQNSATDPDPDLQQKNLNTESDRNKTQVLENKSDLKNESDSENEDENVAGPEPDPEQDSDSETLVNENIDRKQLRSGKPY